MRWRNLASPARPRSFPRIATPHGLGAIRQSARPNAVCASSSPARAARRICRASPRLSPPCPSSACRSKANRSRASTRCCPSCKCRPGVPVATVGIGAARNAGLLAVQILAVGDARLQKRAGRVQKETRRGIARKKQNARCLTRLRMVPRQSVFDEDTRTVQPIAVTMVCF